MQSVISHTSCIHGHMRMGAEATCSPGKQPNLTQSRTQSAVNYGVSPPPGVQHMRIDLADEESANMLEQLPAAMAWLEGALRAKGNRVLVHCHAGESKGGVLLNC